MSKIATVILCVVFAVSVGCTRSRKQAVGSNDSESSVAVQHIPFSLAVVPTSSSGGVGGITMAEHKPNEFYVVFTNISEQPQAVFEQWNSWGYFAISFEFTTDEGRNTTIFRKRTVAFTKNNPSTFAVAAGEHQVFPVRLDKWWHTQPALRKSDEMPVKVKAIYEVSATPESAKQGVWTGRVESKTYDFTLRQW
jgi:hypothetical protein